MLTVEHGHFLLILAGFLAFAQAILGLYGAQRHWQDWMRLTPAISAAQFLAAFGAFVILIMAFMQSDFSVKLVAENSHSTKPMLYKFAGTWGNHEGSMLMWVTILSLFGAAVALTSQNIPLSLRARILGVQGLIGAAFFAFILLTSNPFLRINPVDNGSGLNPILQDPGLAFHPPFLYLGYVGLSVAFSFAIAGLIDGRVDAAWARYVRPWTLAAWIFMTIGIALGSWWAYYELGWGGFWFWDPVENASLMPWLISVALLHSAIVVEKRDSLKSWTILLAILGFSFSLLGTFIVRSGVLTSVHSFASDPTRGAFILAIIMITIIAGFGLYAWRAPKLIPSAVFAPVSRETGIVLNNVLLMIATSVVLIGTLYPLIAEMLLGARLSVGEPFFNLSFTPFMVALALLLPIGASLGWKRGQFHKIRNFAVIIGGLGIAVMLALWLLQSGWSLLAPMAIFLTIWIIGGALWEIGSKFQIRGWHFSTLRTIRASEWGKYLAHSGFALIIMGIGVLKAYEFEDLRAASAPLTYEAAGYHIEFQEVVTGNGPNYRYTRGVFHISKNGQDWWLFPENRDFPVESMPTTEAAIHPYRMGDIYLVMREGQEAGVFSVYFYLKPFANFLWLGAAIMALGGVFSLFDRRLRIGRVSKREAK